MSIFVLDAGLFMTASGFDFDTKMQSYCYISQVLSRDLFLFVVHNLWEFFLSYKNTLWSDLQSKGGIIFNSLLNVLEWFSR